MQPEVNANSRVGEAPAHRALAADIAKQYTLLPQVEAVALGGSRSTGMAGPRSDIDLYVYIRAPIPIAARRELAQRWSSQAEIDNQFWEPGDEWIDAKSQIGVDVMYRTVTWIEEQLARVLEQHQAALGYSTCLWHNVRTSQPLIDRHGWYRRLQEWATQPYPEALRTAIVAKNHPVLRKTNSSYLQQIERALERGDLVSLNHRVAALLASYFDILFAVNRHPHPGEKQLLNYAADQCASRPAGMAADVDALIRAIPTGGEDVVAQANKLLDALDQWFQEEGDSPRLA
jgi:predicted nucleotidyltransferase